jgi:hypothetical protein
MACVVVGGGTAGFVCEHAANSNARLDELTQTANGLLQGILILSGSIGYRPMPAGLKSPH